MPGFPEPRRLTERQIGAQKNESTTTNDRYTDKLPIIGRVSGLPKASRPAEFIPYSEWRCLAPDRHRAPDRDRAERLRSMLTYTVWPVARPGGRALARPVTVEGYEAMLREANRQKATHGPHIEVWRHDGTMMKEVA